VKAAVEVFGLPARVIAEKGQRLVGKYLCPFMGARCDKRAAGVKYPFGVCSADYKPAFLAQATPHIICPHRLVVLQLVFDGKLHAVIASVLCEAIWPFSVRSAARDCFVATRRLLAVTGGLISIIYELKDH